MPLTLAKLVKSGFGKAFLLGKNDFKRMYHFVLIESRFLVCVYVRDVLLSLWTSDEMPGFISLKICSSKHANVAP